MSDTSREYPVRMIARVPREFPQLVSTAATRNYISPSAYLRQALSEKLTRDGLMVEKAADSSGPSRAKAA